MRQEPEIGSKPILCGIEGCPNHASFFACHAEKGMMAACTEHSGRLRKDFGPELMRLLQSGDFVVLCGERRFMQFRNWLEQYATLYQRNDDTH